MVKLSAPVSSIDATGKLGRELQFSHWKGRHVLGRRRRPRQPNTEPQCSPRILTSFLTQNWRNLTAAEQLAWSNASVPTGLPPYQFYLKTNCTRFFSLPHDHLNSLNYDTWPSATWPADRSTNPATGTWPPMTGGQGYAELEFTVGAINDNWILFFCHADLAPTKPGPTNLKAIFLLDTAGVHNLRIEPLTPGLWKFCFQRISRTGKPRSYYNQVSATVT